MTGNTVLLGTATFLERDLLHPFIALNGCAFGAALAAFLKQRVRQVGILVAYFLSAIGTALLFREARLAVGALPAASVLVVAAYGMGRGSGEPAQKRPPGTRAA